MLAEQLVHGPGPGTREAERPYAASAQEPLEGQVGSTEIKPAWGAGGGGGEEVGGWGLGGVGGWGLGEGGSGRGGMGGR